MKAFVKAAPYPRGSVVAQVRKSVTRMSIIMKRIIDSSNTTHASRDNIIWLHAGLLPAWLDACRHRLPHVLCKFARFPSWLGHSYAFGSGDVPH